MQLMKEERLSADKCLQTCAQLSDNIIPVQLHARQCELSPPGSVNSEATPERFTNKGLIATLLEWNMQGLIDRQMRQSNTLMTEEEATDLARMREEWQTARQCIDICSRADTQLKEHISIIENHAIGDEIIQYLVSTNGKPMYGKNRGYGWKNRQVGGHLSDTSLQKLSQNILDMGIQSSRKDSSSSRGSSPSPSTPGNNDNIANQPSSAFGEHLGRDSD